MDKFNSIIEKLKRYPLKLKYSEFVFGAHYKAYYNNEHRLVMCSCEKKSIENRIKIYNTFNKREFSNVNCRYLDYIYDIDYIQMTLKQFLGLPTELNLDYSIDVINQIIFEDNICHRCCGVDYEWNIPVKNPFNYKKLKNKTRNAKRELEKENYFISKGILYTPIVKVSYVLVDELDEYAKEMLKPNIRDFVIPEKYCIGYQKFEANLNSKKQISEIEKFLALSINTQLKLIYRNLSLQESEKIANRFDRKLLNMSFTIPRESSRAVQIAEMKNIDKKVRDLQLYYGKDFPSSTFPISEIMTLYEEAYEFDYLFYDDEYFDDENNSAYLSFCKQIIPFLHSYIDLGGDVNLTYTTKYDEKIEPIKYMIILTKNKDLMIKANIPIVPRYRKI